MGKRNRVKRRDMPPEVAEMFERTPELAARWEEIQAVGSLGLTPLEAMKLTSSMPTEELEAMDQEVEDALTFIQAETGCNRDRALLTLIDFVNDPSRYPQWAGVGPNVLDGESNNLHQ